MTRWSAREGGRFVLLLSERVFVNSNFTGCELCQEVEGTLLMMDWQQRA